MNLTLDGAGESHWNPEKKDWRLIGTDIIKCPATGEHIDKPSCQSSCNGKGCIYLKDGECTYRGEEEDLREERDNNGT